MVLPRLQQSKIVCLYSFGDSCVWTNHWQSNMKVAIKTLTFINEVKGNKYKWKQWDGSNSSVWVLHHHHHHHQWFSAQAADVVFRAALITAHSRQSQREVPLAPVGTGPVRARLPVRSRLCDPQQLRERREQRDTFIRARSGVPVQIRVQEPVTSETQTQTWTQTQLRKEFSQSLVPKTPFSDPFLLLCEEHFNNIKKLYLVIN